MFLKYKVDIPVVPGKLVRKNRGGHTYIEYEYDRIYDPAKQYTYPKRVSIGRVDPENPTRMTPNENFLKYFPDAEIPEETDRSERSPYLNIGTYVVLHKLIQDCKLKEIIYVFLTIFLYLLKCPQSLILSALRAFFFCGKPHISRSIFLYFLYQTWLKSW